MIKTLKNLLKQDKERYTVPRKVQDVIPVRRIWKDGIFQVGSRFSKTYQFTDINYLVASREDKEQMFLAYSELLNSLDSGATTKITINNRRLNRANFEQSILMPMRGDACDVYRREYNQMLLDKATDANGIIESTKSSALIRYLALANMRSWRCSRPSPIPSRASSITTLPVRSRRRTLMLISPNARHFLFMTPALRRNTAIS